MNDVADLDKNAAKDLVKKGEMFWTIMMSDMGTGAVKIKYLQLAKPSEEHVSRFDWSDSREKATKFLNFNETVRIFKQVFEATHLPITMAFCGWYLEREEK
ncbi:hypothetical protein [Liquorilactobacillus hordei]|uniref:Uncharacterized protein n=1 Tax=Liquorilactobacillus hordei DSM 19519 TaxID=1423759 RepID=A0A0R1MJ22_9LACO|nr:hypothetical protein [Liquorilactobacillus hordei]KRL07966.1 hypothetical protein FC92_GL001035 [Liquorilactobacillus hordei DSM 19519]QYH51090.1 hypothetical protein G6O70_00580 [Liquorilactobacillus hordei DSM 19519]